MEVKYSGSPATVTKWRVRRGQMVTTSTVLCNLSGVDANGEERRVVSKYSGRISSLLKKEGDSISESDVLVRVEVCRHDIVIKDLCAECGVNLRTIDGMPGERKEAATASVAMVHNIPELYVSEEKANELADEETSRLLKSRKLVLLIDLDQTLIHTTCDDVPLYLKDVHHFQLPPGGQGAPFYHTKLRPGTKDFLEKMSELFELHIVTFGNRLYAHTIARLIDPETKFFGHRILSRDEAFNPLTKTANLKSLFPRGDSMVCIIDDRAEVWSFSKHLIHVKPYKYFRDTDDINLPGQENGHRQRSTPRESHRHRSSKRRSQSKERHKHSRRRRHVDRNGNHKSGETERPHPLRENENVGEAAVEEDETPEVERRLTLNAQKMTETLNKDADKQSGEQNKKLVEPPQSGKAEGSPGESGKAEGSPEESGKAEGSPEESGKAEGSPEESGKAEGSPEESGKAEGSPEESGKAEGSLEVPVKAEWSPEESGKAEGSLEVPVKAEGSPEESGKAEGSLEGPVKAEEGSIAKTKESVEMQRPAGSESALLTAADEEDWKEALNLSDEDLETGRGQDDPWLDRDDYLLHLSDILRRIHEAFYAAFDARTDDELPDLKEMIPQLRGSTLANIRVVFSGVVPLGHSVQQSGAFHMARHLGADVQSELQTSGPHRTNYVIASRAGTRKVSAAKKAKVRVVSPHWLWETYYQWRRLSGRQFRLEQDYDPNSFDFNDRKRPLPPTDELTPREKLAKMEEVATPSFVPHPSLDFLRNPLMQISAKDTVDMEDEVDAAMDEDEDEDEDEDDDDEDEEEEEEEQVSLLLGNLGNDSSAESSDQDSLSGAEYPKGWRPQRGSCGRSVSSEEEDREYRTCPEGYDYEDAEYTRKILRDDISSSEGEQGASGTELTDEEECMDALRAFI